MIENLLHSMLALGGRVLTQGRLSILIYHQVLPSYDALRPNEPTVAVFDWQMALIRRYFTPISLTEGVRRLADKTLPSNAVCVTFDDGYLNNLTLAQPVLEKHGIPATVYIATGFSEGKNMWNDRILHLFEQRDLKQLNLPGETIQIPEQDEARREIAYSLLRKSKYLPPVQRDAFVDELYALNPQVVEAQSKMMTPEQVRQLAALGVTIGAHTVEHPILAVLDEQQQLQQIRDSKQRLEAWLQQPVEHFAYPNGVWPKDLTQDTINIVKSLGFSSAVITNWGAAKQETSAFALPRFTPWDRSKLKFHIRLLLNILRHKI
ncbi:polysaccharide deacetylase family protein [Bowmanella yangjiangensis]|uniref:Polysaccharide deacetylase family protein n=1 Tax=Bowmanella yangjiangensis TaxID=2811230 RepID=A0ABS3CW57_9ALTE|nr:polysaccharide deacetylase family protein [Bowmanella yangjiangensis]MBN7820381.1 polysaccharide deacetylase family protein [Bowmanella yangjiangensis]